MTTSEKNCDSHNRLRNRTIGFRVSPEEWDLLDRTIKLSGLNKQDYIIANCLHKEITVQPNPRVAVSLKKELKHLTEALQIREDLSPELQELLQTSVKMLQDMYYTNHE